MSIPLKRSYEREDHYLASREKTYCRGPAKKMRREYGRSSDDERPLFRRVLTIARDRSSDQIESAIKRSLYILSIGDNFDGEGSPGYSKATWDRAIAYLRALEASARSDSSFTLAPPTIAPGPDGDIDLIWETDTFKCLINIPADPNEPATYYGEGSGGRLGNPLPLENASLGVSVLRALSGL